MRKLLVQGVPVLLGHNVTGLITRIHSLKNRLLSVYYTPWASLVAQTVKRLSAMQETWVRSLGWEDPLEKEWQPTPVFLPGKSHGRRSLVGYRPWGRKESDTTERLHFHFHYTPTSFVTSDVQKFPEGKYSRVIGN